MDNSAAAMVAPAIENCTVRQTRRPNAALRTREHPTTQEVEKLIEIASGNRQGQRDSLMVLLAFRHGLRAAEVCGLRWEQIDFATATLHVRRIKHGTPATHPLTGREMRVLGARCYLSGLDVRDPHSLSLQFFLDQPTRHLHCPRHSRHRYVLRYCQRHCLILACAQRSYHNTIIADH
jgi:integrase